MREHATSATGGTDDPESPISTSIGAAERQLHGLYLEPTGQMEPGQDWGWCGQCGRHAVFPHAGEDTCRACVAEIPVGSAGSSA